MSDRGQAGGLQEGSQVVDKRRTRTARSGAETEAEELARDTVAGRERDALETASGGSI